MLRFAVLASGTGSNFRAILRHVHEGRINAEIALVLSNVPDAPALTIAREAGISTWAKAHATFPSRAAFDAAMLEAMRSAKIDAVILAGYMRLLSPSFIQAYSGKILNIHPSLLPAFPGAHGADDALAYGVRFTGCTVHFVVEEMDAGAIIIQAALPVEAEDTKETLMPRVHALEHRIYPQAVAWLASGRLSLEGRKARLVAAPGVRFSPTEMANLVNPPLEEGF